MKQPKEPQVIIPLDFLQKITKANEETLKIINKIDDRLKGVERVIGQTDEPKPANNLSIDLSPLLPPGIKANIKADFLRGPSTMTTKDCDAHFQLFVSELTGLFDRFQVKSFEASFTAK